VLRFHPGFSFLQKHELRSLASVAAVDSAGAINFPLTVIVDYCGFRLTVMSRLPVSVATICMGMSAEGYHCSDEVGALWSSRGAGHVGVLCAYVVCLRHGLFQEVVELMTDLSSKLNLADHMVYMGGEPVARSMVCGDIELHRLKDHSVFMFSAHRLFPSAAALRGSK
jgi:hypothetical protein